MDRFLLIIAEMKLCALILSSAFLILGLGFADIQPLPIAGVTAISFSPASGGQALVSDLANLGQVLSATVEDGKIIASDDGKGFDWEVTQEVDFGKGRLKIDLDRTRIASDLAMVMNVHVSHQSKLAVQFFDKDGAALALDLFGELKANAERAATDTFILPLEQYPLAKSLVIRRLSGPLRISEILLTPVISAVSKTPGMDAELAKILGIRLDEYNRSSKREMAPQDLIVRRIPSLEEINEIGASALSNAGYPRYRRLKGPRSSNVFSPVSGTTYDFAILANRLISMEANQPVFRLFFTSSDGVHWFFPGNDSEATDRRPGSAEFGMCSIKMDESAKEKFLLEKGFPIIEIPIARSAIEILVHEKNPISSLTSAQLASAFGTENQAHRWADLGLENHALSTQRLQVFGGNPSWGTGRMFQEIALHGKGWRNDIDARYDVVYSDGVESKVAEALNAIGYAAQSSRVYPVKVLAIESVGGGPALLPTEEAIYSSKYPLQRKLYAVIAAPQLSQASPAVREMVNLILSDQGQTLMARTRNLPLAAEEVVALREKLGLPK